MHGAAQNHPSDRLVAADSSERSRVMELARTFNSSASSAEDFSSGVATVESKSSSCNSAMDATSSATHPHKPTGLLSPTPIPATGPTWAPLTEQRNLSMTRTRPVHVGTRQGKRSGHRGQGAGSWVGITRVEIRLDMAESFSHFSHLLKLSQESHEIDPGSIG